MNFKLFVWLCCLCVLVAHAAASPLAAGALDSAGADAGLVARFARSVSSTDDCLPGQIKIGKGCFFDDRSSSSSEESSEEEPSKE